MICCHTGRPGCPLCEGVIARRAIEARVWVETSSAREASRCPLCAFLTDQTDRDGRHAPDCIAAAGPETERLIRFLEARQENL
jgi:hypothetical protein